MSKKGLIITIIIAVLVLVGVLFIVKNNTQNIKSGELPNSVTIKQYEVGTNNVVMKRTIESKKDLREFSRIVEGMKPLSDNEMVDLAILYEYEVSYDDVIIRYNPSEKNYCYYIKDGKESLAKLPDGLSLWVASLMLIG